MAHPYMSQHKASIRSRLSRLGATAGKSFGAASMEVKSSYPKKRAGSSTPMTISGGNAKKRADRYARGGKVGKGKGKKVGSTTNIVIAGGGGEKGPVDRPVPIPVPVGGGRPAGLPTPPSGAPAGLGPPPAGPVGVPIMAGGPPPGPMPGARPVKTGGAVFKRGGNVKRQAGGNTPPINPPFGDLGSSSVASGGGGGGGGGGGSGLGSSEEEDTKKSEGFTPSPPPGGRLSRPPISLLSDEDEEEPEKRQFGGMTGGRTSRGRRPPTTFGSGAQKAVAGGSQIPSARGVIGRAKVVPPPGMSTGFKKGGKAKYKAGGFTGKGEGTPGPIWHNQGKGYDKGGAVKKLADGGSSGVRRLKYNKSAAHITNKEG